MIRNIVAALVSVVTLVAICVVMAKSEKEKWDGHACFISELVISEIGNGLIRLITGHNLAIEMLVAFVRICRQHLSVTVACLSFYLVAELTGRWVSRATQQSVSSNDGGQTFTTGPIQPGANSLPITVPASASYTVSPAGLQGNITVIG